VKIEKHVFRGQVVALDGNEFVDCAFYECCLTYAGGICSLRECRVEGGNIKMIGAAQNTVKLIKALSKSGSGFQEAIAKEIDGLYKLRVMAPPP
jgi:hypothetical protein